MCPLEWGVHLGGKQETTNPRLLPAPNNQTVAILLQGLVQFLEYSHPDLLHSGAQRCSLWDQLFWAGSFSLPALNSVDVMKGLIQEL